MQVLPVWVMILVAMRVGATGHAETAVPASHALAMYGQPKYGPDFTHFDYVNPQAPRGGMIRLADDGTFDSFNPRSRTHWLRIMFRDPSRVV
jgi:microcin C transport system substrate-binding protein